MLLPQIAVMLIIMLTGVLCRKIGVISGKAYHDLSNLLLFVVNPIFIFMTFEQQPYDADKMRGLFVGIVLSAVGMVISILLAQLLLPGKNNPLAGVERLCATYPNASFFAIPLVHGMFGADGVFYLTGTVLVFNLLLWTHGVLLLRQQGEPICLKALSKRLLNPVIIAAVVGFVAYLLHLRIPTVLADAFHHIGRMNTPLAMLITGGVLAGANLTQALANKRIYYILLLRLLFIPIVVAFVFSFFTHMIPAELHTIILIALSAPTVTSCVAIAVLYDTEPLYVSEVVAVSTVFALITIPKIIWLSSLLPWV